MPKSIWGRAMTDPYLLRKIRTATSLEEIAGMEEQFEKDGRQIPKNAIHAIAHRKIDLQRVNA